MMDSNKNRNLIYKTKLTNVGFANSARTKIWCPVFDFRFENIQWFRGLYIDRDHIPQISAIIVGEMPFLTLYISISKYCEVFMYSDRFVYFQKFQEACFIVTTYFLNTLPWVLFIFAFNFLLSITQTKRQ